MREGERLSRPLGPIQCGPLHPSDYKMNTNIISQSLRDVAESDGLYDHKLTAILNAIADRIEVLESDRASAEVANHNEIMRMIDPHGQGL